MTKEIIKELQRASLHSENHSEWPKLHFHIWTNPKEYQVFGQAECWKQDIFKTKQKAEYLYSNFGSWRLRPNSEKFWLWPNTCALGRPLKTNSCNLKRHWLHCAGLKVKVSENNWVSGTFLVRLSIVLL